MHPLENQFPMTLIGPGVKLDTSTNENSFGVCTILGVVWPDGPERKTPVDQPIRSSAR